MRDVKEIKPTALLSEIERVEMAEEGVVAVMKDGGRIFLKSDQVSQLWGMLTMGLDSLCLGKLSGKIKRLGLWPVIHDALQGAKVVMSDERQKVLPGVGE